MNKKNIPAKHTILDPYLSKLIQETIGKKEAQIFDYGCGDGHVLLNLNQDYNIVAYDNDSNIIHKLVKKLEKINCKNIKAINENHFFEKKQDFSLKFDLVLCSLVLCLYEDKKEMQNILSDLKILAKENGLIIIVICNPLFIHELESETIIRHLPKDWQYDQTFKYSKTVKLTNNKRYDVHRPLKEYETIIHKSGLKIEALLQVPPVFQREKFISDYLIFMCRLQGDEFI
ncbi:MAG: methyltransferase domain-containing protein [Candidatus Heimdallarchaeota archaeon]